MSTAVQRNLHLYGNRIGDADSAAAVATTAPSWGAPRTSYKPEVIVISDSEGGDADEDIANYRTTTASSTMSFMSPSSSTTGGGRRSQKRPRGGVAREEDELLSTVAQRRRVIQGGIIDDDDDDDQDEYIPPSQPIVKPKDVRVRAVYDRYPHTTAVSPCDDSDGHYIVRPNAPFTDRYEIRELLGQGTFGKVVSAYDRETKRHCAIKIIRSVQKYREASQIELRVLTTLSMYDRDNANRCIQLRECFDYRNHICIVTDLLGLSVYDFMKGNGFLPFPGSHIQILARQLVKSVAFLHDLNLVHTDLKPENILLESDDNIERPYRVRRGRTPPKQRRILLNTSIHLIDFGSAIFNDEYHSSVVSTRHYRAPEIILGTGWSFPCDMWSIGCILVEFCTGSALFQTHNNAEHLALMERILGAKLDRHMAQMAVCNPTGAALVNRDSLDIMYPEASTTKSSRKYVSSTKSFDKLIMSCVDYSRNPSFWSAFIDLLGQILVYDPAQRITARQALAHPWFKLHISDDGNDQ
jgi:dual-specificity kinase